MTVSENIDTFIELLIELEAKTRLKRSRLEMSLEVFNIIEKKTIPTRAMFTANLSWDRFTRILEGLKAVGLVKETILKGVSAPGRVGLSEEDCLCKTGRLQRRYAVTEKGVKVLRLFRDLNGLLCGVSE